MSTTLGLCAKVWGTKAGDSGSFWCKVQGVRSLGMKVLGDELRDYAGLVWGTQGLGNPPT